METAKEILIKTIREQPDDSTYEDLLKELLFHRMILRGLQDVKQTHTISHEDVEKEIISWEK